MTLLIKKIICKWSNSGIIEKSDEDVYEYGLELLLCTILNIAVILVSAGLVGKLPEGFALLAVTLPLQSCGGGYHAKTHLRCFLAMYIVWWFAFFILPFITPVVATILSVLSMPIVFKLAPVSHVNVEMSERQRLKMRKFVWILAIIVLFLSNTLIWGVSERIGIAMSLGMGLTAISMVAAYFKNLYDKKRLKFI